MSDNRRYYGGTGDPYSRTGQGLGTGRFKLMLILGLAMAAYQAFKFFSNTQVNTITNESQHIQWTPEEEISLGLQAAPQMAQQYGGLHPDQKAQDYLDQVGQKLALALVQLARAHRQLVAAHLVDRDVAHDQGDAGVVAAQREVVLGARALVELD